jgi:hypothetical protein
MHKIDLIQFLNIPFNVNNNFININTILVVIIHLIIFTKFIILILSSQVLIQLILLKYMKKNIKYMMDQLKQ